MEQETVELSKLRWWSSLKYFKKISLHNVEISSVNTCILYSKLVHCFRRASFFASMKRNSLLGKLGKCVFKSPEIIVHSG